MLFLGVGGFVNGAIICFDGIDGCGKSTQVHLLEELLVDKGMPYHIYHYPDYNSDYGKIVDRYLNGHLTLSVDELFLLHIADMAKDKERVKNELRQGYTVIMDRYFYSTVAYQSGGGFDYERAKKIVALLDLPLPSLLFYLDVDVGTGIQRKTRQKDADRFENDEKYMRSVKDFFDKMADEHFSKTKWVTIDGSRTIADVRKKVMTSIKELGINL
jgi:dTMP kinase